MKYSIFMVCLVYMVTTVAAAPNVRLSNGIHKMRQQTDIITTLLSTLKKQVNGSAKVLSDLLNYQSHFSDPSLETSAQLLRMNYGTNVHNLTPCFIQKRETIETEQIAAKRFRINTTMNLSQPGKFVKEEWVFNMCTNDCIGEKEERVVDLIASSYYS